MSGLRHFWMWTRHARPHVPVWSYSRVPKSTLSPNENARLLNVYMRPWTLNLAEVSEDNVLLSEMAQIPNESKSCDGAKTLSEPPSSDSSKKRRVEVNTPENEEASVEAPPTKQCLSHVSTWNWYINGHVVSHTGKRYINNMLAVTAARVVQKADESSDDDEGPKHFSADVGDLNLIMDTLRGIAMRDEDDGAQGFGRHAVCIDLGRGRSNVLEIPLGRKNQYKTITVLVSSRRHGPSPNFD